MEQARFETKFSINVSDAVRRQMHKVCYLNPKGYSVIDTLVSFMVNTSQQCYCCVRVL